MEKMVVVVVHGNPASRMATQEIMTLLLLLPFLLPVAIIHDPFRALRRCIRVEGVG